LGKLADVFLRLALVIIPKLLETLNDIALEDAAKQTEQTVPGIIADNFSLSTTEQSAAGQSETTSNQQAPSEKQSEETLQDILQRGQNVIRI
jgi:hypothetical protein